MSSGKNQKNRNNTQPEPKVEKFDAEEVRGMLRRQLLSDWDVWLWEDLASAVLMKTNPELVEGRRKQTATYVGRMLRHTYPHLRKTPAKIWELNHIIAVIQFEADYTSKNRPEAVAPKEKGSQPPVPPPAPPAPPVLKAPEMSTK